MQLVYQFHVNIKSFLSVKTGFPKVFKNKLFFSEQLSCLQNRTLQGYHWDKHDTTTKLLLCIKIITFSSHSGLWSCRAPFGRA